MVVEKDAEFYNMDHPNRGCAYIFCNRKFKKRGLETKSGVDKDCEKIMTCLTKLGFTKIFYCEDLKLAKIRQKIDEAVKMDHTDDDCFMLFVLTHGHDGILQARDEAYDPELVFWSQFTAEKCPTLAGKPKLFFVHARQGSNVDPGIQLVHKLRRTETDGRQIYRIPIQADFLFMYSTTRGYHAFDDEKGSHFIYVLMEELEKGINKKDFLKILTLVNQRVAVEFTSNHFDIEKHNKKQAPYFHSYLIRNMQFLVKNQDEEVATNTDMFKKTVFHSIRGDNPDEKSLNENPSKDIPKGEISINQTKNSSGMPPENSAWASVSKDDLHYKMNHGNKGVAYIFNHEKFHEDMCPQRHATDFDIKKVEQCFRNLGFEVNPFLDLKLNEIRYQIEQAVNMDHTNRDCFALVVLSHGEHDLLYAYDTCYDPNEELWSQFTADKCPSLAGKPKLFFIQACQGDGIDSGVPIVHNKLSRTETDGEQLPYTIPVHSDFLIVFATAKGYVAFRNKELGSYFLTVLCDELQNRAYNDHLLNILTKVNRRVAIDFTNLSNEPKRHMKKQIPYFHSSLTRLMQFVETPKLWDD